MTKKRIDSTKEFIKRLLTEDSTELLKDRVDEDMLGAINESLDLINLEKFKNVSDEFLKNKFVTLMLVGYMVRSHQLRLDLDLMLA